MTSPRDLRIGPLSHVVASTVIVPPRLLAIAADAHIAPKPAAVATPVEEQPAAIAADADPPARVGLKQRERRDGDRCLEFDPALPGGEARAVRCNLYRRRCERVGTAIEQRGEMLGPNGPRRRRVAEQRIRHLAQCDDPRLRAGWVGHDQRIAADLAWAAVYRRDALIAHRQRNPHLKALYVRAALDCVRDARSLMTNFARLPG